MKVSVFVVLVIGMLMLVAASRRLHRWHTMRQAAWELERIEWRRWISRP